MTHQWPRRAPLRRRERRHEVPESVAHPGGWATAAAAAATTTTVWQGSRRRGEGRGSAAVLHRSDLLVGSNGLGRRDLAQGAHLTATSELGVHRMLWKSL